MAKVDPFLVGLQHISSNLSRPELEEMKFLCKTKIGKKKLNEIQQGIELFSCLMQQNLLSPSDTAFLISMLQSLKREDLIQDLANYIENKPGPVEQLDPQVEAQLEVAFETLCDNVGQDWKRLARKLGISQVDIDRIIYAYPRDLKEQFYQSLLLWKKASDKEANVSTIQKALRDCRLNLAADILAEKLEAMLL
ncbi:FAS-associated death domain protein [Dromiciops gliroides]|uniref:FAS-associated death domain protein n=1 Tax=Dromiciops gliroides TaxID=33562 RepID=UPI001CC6DB20|nr:FAS-associated death domain protein [Dromiciops gliroides]XP_043825760.1 FAS-associated death domain protein [Dromiciops gliroides]XP_043825761.1 FAS-associated death domain protein [Dromiciops gliroides]